MQKGIPIYEVMHLTGHNSLAMVQRYSHLAPDYQNRAIEGFNGFGHSFGTVVLGKGQVSSLRFLADQFGDWCLGLHMAQSRPHVMGTVKTIART